MPKLSLMGAGLAQVPGLGNSHSALLPCCPADVVIIALFSFFKESSGLLWIVGRGGGQSELRWWAGTQGPQLSPEAVTLQGGQGGA